MQIVDISAKKLSYFETINVPDFSQIPPSVTLVVLDGITTDNKKDVMPSLAVWWKLRSLSYPNTTFRFIVVSSFGLTADLETQRHLKVRMVSTCGWTLEEYNEACKDDQLFQSVKDNLHCPDIASTGDRNMQQPENRNPEDSESVQLQREKAIANKFFFAGYSARWMFGANLTMVLNDITAQFLKVMNLEYLVRYLLDGYANTGVNQLGSLLYLGGIGYRVLVSKYVTQLLNHKTWYRLITEMTTYSRRLPAHNESFDTWIFQYDFESRLIGYSNLSFVPLNYWRQGELWLNPQCIRVHVVTDLLSGPEIQDGCWLLLEKINLAGYEHSQKALRFVLATADQTQGIDLTLLTRVIPALESKGITIHFLDVVIVVPKGNRTNFTLGRVTGDQKKIVRTKKPLFKTYQPDNNQTQENTGLDSTSEVDDRDGWTLSDIRILEMKRTSHPKKITNRTPTLNYTLTETSMTEPTSTLMVTTDANVEEQAEEFGAQKRSVSVADLGDNAERAKLPRLDNHQCT